MDEKLKQRILQYEMMAFIVKEFTAELGKEKALEIVCRALEKLQVVTAKRWTEEAGGNTIQHLAKFMQKTAQDSGTLEVLEATDKRLAIKVNRCLGAEAMEHLGIADVCRIYCDTDEVLTKAFNPRLKFSRTKTIAAGDDCCDHTWDLQE